MIQKTSSFLLGLILMIFLSGTMASSQDVVIVSSQAGECELRVESDQKWQTLRLRAHHPKHRGCQITRDEMISILDKAFSKTVPPKLEGPYSSLFLGRLIDYPWLSQHLATTAYRDRGWDSKRGKPVAMDINKYVAQLLSRKELIAQIEAPFEKGGYRVVSVTVEKVLVGGFREVPFYQGEIHPGKVPYDVQAWLNLKKN